jgi:C-terminal processing protease CtpA/Prc
LSHPRRHLSTIQNVQPGDKLLRIDGLETKHASWGAIYAALHGKPGEVRHLLLERNGIQLKVAATVIAF